MRQTEILLLCSTSAAPLCLFDVLVKPAVDDGFLNVSFLDYYELQSDFGRSMFCMSVNIFWRSRCLNKLLYCYHKAYPFKIGVVCLALESCESR